MNNLDMIRAIGYIRVSSDEQVKNFSLDNQEQYIRHECQKRDWELVKIFRDEGQSATTLKRQGLIDALEFCSRANNYINYFVAQRLDRISRETSDYLAVRKTLAGYGVTLFSCNEPIGGDSPADKFLEIVLAAAAQLDNEVRGRRALDGMKSRFMSGWANGKAPLGYRTGTDERGKLIHIPDPEIFPKLQQAWQIMATGTKTLREIADYMTQLGIKASRNKKEVPIQTANSIFRHKYYMGIITSKWGERKGNQIPMVDEDTWIAVQKLLTHRDTKSGIYLKRLVSSEDFPIRRIVKCDVCGRGLTAAWSRGRHGKLYGYYFCADRCRPSIPIKTLESAMEEFLRGISPTKKTIDLFTLYLHAEYHKRYTSITDAKVAASRRVVVVKEMRIKLAEDHNKGIYTDEIYKTLDIKLDHEMLALRTVESETIIEKFEIDAAINFCHSFLKDLSQPYLISNPGQKRVLLSSISPVGLTYEDGKVRTPQLSPLFSLFSTIKSPDFSFGGTDGIRTRDPLLGKEVLYH